MITARELGERLKERLEKSGESGNALAKRIGIQQASVSKLTRGQQQGVSFESAIKIMQELGYTILPPGSISTVGGIMRINGQLASANCDERELEGKGITILGVHVATGADPEWEESNSEPIFNIAVPDQYLRPKMSALFVFGRSMEPTILDNSVVGVDRERVDIIPGKIYAVRVPYEGIVVKRLFLDHSEKCFVLRSDNNDFPDIKMPLEDGNEFIYGRVCWALQSYDR